MKFNSKGNFKDGFETKTARAIFYCIIYSVVAFLVIFNIWNYFFGITGKEYRLQQARSEAFRGRVDSIYNDTRNHNVEMALLNNGYRYGIYRGWEAIIEQGDSLSKQRGSYQVIVFKKRGKKVILDYIELMKGYK